ncbi:hypothetical protein B0H63DRAFT_556995 [Podospora didyma]|uniref:Zn(2)-C6 fungal-type domain-containing protein n=1 Tax=Podospora didyma TaxID=330526 RepID=A0AAE0U457_9PEZI|nr:hypothetical protein B0H63DRAFT_556995 [Podospora didyma]
MSAHEQGHRALKAQSGGINKTRDYHVICFSARPSKAQPGKKRTKFTPHRQQEVAAVRRRGACLRCRLLKITCSGDDPCKTCLDLASKKQENKVLSFTFCVRTKFGDVDIFAQGIEQTDTTAQKAALLDARNTALEFAFNWSIPDLVGIVSNWFEHPADVSLSLAGTFSSRQMSDLLRPHLDDQITSQHRMLVYASTLAYVHSDYGLREAWEGQLGQSDLHQVAYVAGHNLIRELDRILSPTWIAKASKETVEALFLLTFGTMLAIGYSQPMSIGQDIPPSTLWIAMQGHLSQMLAHYLVFLGAKLGICFNTETEKQITSSPETKWKRRGRFTWKTKIFIEEETVYEENLCPSWDPNKPVLIIPNIQHDTALLKLSDAGLGSYGNACPGNLLGFINSLPQDQPVDIEHGDGSRNPQRDMTVDRYCFRADPEPPMSSMSQPSQLGVRYLEVVKRGNQTRVRVQNGPEGSSPIDVDFGIFFGAEQTSCSGEPSPGNICVPFGPAEARLLV